MLKLCLRDQSIKLYFRIRHVDKSCPPFSRVFNATDNLKAIRATHSFLGLNENFTKLEIGDKKLVLTSFWKSILPPILLLMGVWEQKVHHNFIIIQANIVSSPPNIRGGGISFLKIGQRGGSRKNCSEIGDWLKRGRFS